MTKENLERIESILKKNPYLKLEKDSWDYMFDELESSSLLLRDLFSGPLDAAMRGITFPIGHAKFLEEMVDQIDYFECWLSKDQFIDNRIKDKDALVNDLREVVKSFQPLIDNLKSDDIGASKGFKCIYDHRAAYDKVVNEKLDPFIRRAKESFIQTQ